MGVGEIVALFAGGEVLLLTAIFGAALVFRQAKDRPRPLQEVVEALGVELSRMKASIEENDAALKRAIQREAKAERRAARVPAPPPEANGDLDPDRPAIDQLDLSFDPRKRFP